MVIRQSYFAIVKQLIFVILANFYPFEYLFPYYLAVPSDLVKKKRASPKEDALLVPYENKNPNTKMFIFVTT
ncbi:hypothetical protein [Enterococcus alishanensis]